MLRAMALRMVRSAVRVAYSNNEIRCCTNEDSCNAFRFYLSDLSVGQEFVRSLPRVAMLATVVEPLVVLRVLLAITPM